MSPDPSVIQPPDGGWGGPAALLTAAGALVTALFKGRGVSRHSVNNAINAAVGPLGNRVTALEAHQQEITKRLDRMDSKLDRLLDRSRE